MVKILPKIRVKKNRDPSLTIKTKRSSCDETQIMEDHVNSDDTKATKKKMTRQDKLAAQKLAKERERTARAAAALDDKGNSLFERGHFDKAMICYSKALKMKRRTFNNMLEDAEDFDAKSTKKLSKSDSQVLVSMATSINNIGYLRQRSGEASTEETMAAYQKSLRIKRQILGNSSLSVGKTLNNIGSVYYITRDFEGALKAYSEAMEIMKKNLGDQHPDIATVMSNIGDVHLANGKEQECLQHYRSALNIRYANFGKHDPRVVRLLEKIARIEIGDMGIPQDDMSMMDKDWEDNALLKWGLMPLHAEYQILHGELKADIEYLDELQKRVSKNIEEENVEVARDLQDPPSVSDDEDDDDDASDVDSIDESELRVPQEARAPADNVRRLYPDATEDSLAELHQSGLCHKEALNHVNYRLDKIRSLKSSKTKEIEEEDEDEEDDIIQVTRRDTMSTAGSNELFHQYYDVQSPQQPQPDDNADESFDSTNSDDVFGQYYGQEMKPSTSNRLRQMNSNARIRKSMNGNQTYDNADETVCSTNSDDVFGQYYGQQMKPSSSNGLGQTDPNARIRKSTKMNGNRRVIVTS